MVVVCGNVLGVMTVSVRRMIRMPMIGFAQMQVRERDQLPEQQEAGRDSERTQSALWVECQC